MAKRCWHINVIEAKAENRIEFTRIANLTDSLIRKYKTSEKLYNGKSTIVYTIYKTERCFDKLWSALTKLNPRISNVCVII